MRRLERARIDIVSRAGLSPRGIALVAAFEAGGLAGALMALTCVAVAPSAASWAGVVCAMATALLWHLRGARRRAVDAALGAIQLVLLAFALAAALGVMATAAWVARDAGRVVAVAAVAVAVGLSVAVAHLWPARHEASFAAAVLCLGTALRLGYVCLVRVEPTSDFAIMWRLASDAARGVPLPAAADLAGYFPAGVYLERIFLYLLPLTRLAHGSAFGFRIANALLGGLTAWLMYRFARRWLGALTARLTLILALLAIEPMLAAAVPTHDIPAALLTAAFVAGAAAALERIGNGERSLGLAVGLGLLVTALEFQRSTGAAAVYGLTLASFVFVLEKSAPQASLRVGVALVVIILTSWSLAAALRSSRWAESTASRARRAALATATATDSWTTTLWGNPEDNYQHRYGDIDVDWPGSPP